MQPKPKTHSYLVKRFDCTGLEAAGILQKGKALASVFVDLRRYYSVEHLKRSEEIKASLTTGLQNQLSVRETLKLKGGVKYLLEKRKFASLIRGDLKAMWVAFRDAKRLEQELMFAHNVFALEIDERNFMTAVFEVLQESGELSDAQAVAEGREAYTTLVKSGLPSWVGYDTPKTEEIWYSHGFYYRN